MKTLRYKLTIRDTGSDDCMIEIMLEDENGPNTGRVRVSMAPLVPVINQLKSTLIEDAEGRL